MNLLSLCHLLNKNNDIAISKIHANIEQMINIMDNSFDLPAISATVLIIQGVCVVSVGLVD